MNVATATAILSAVRGTAPGTRVSALERACRDPLAIGKLFAAAGASPGPREDPRVAAQALVAGALAMLGLVESPDVRFSELAAAFARFQESRATLAPDPLASAKGDWDRARKEAAQAERDVAHAHREAVDVLARLNLLRASLSALEATLADRQRAEVEAKADIDRKRAALARVTVELKEIEAGAAAAARGREAAAAREEEREAAAAVESEAHARALATGREVHEALAKRCDAQAAAREAEVDELRRAGREALASK